MIKIRDASEEDVRDIRDIYRTIYGDHYAFPQYYDITWLKKMIYSADTLMLVAEDAEANRVVGTASVVLDIGAYGDLLGEFGRLAVHPDWRKKGVGKALMEERLARVQEQLHVGIVDNRVTHPFSQRISLAQGFAPVGLVPLQLLLKTRESVALFVRHFGDCLQLRRNHPHILPEIYPLARLALQNCQMKNDLLVEEQTTPYPLIENYDVEELTAEGYSSLLRFERGRVRHREIFGPMRLHFGLFKIRARGSSYLIARENGHVVGAIGFTKDQYEKAVRIFEVITLSDEPIHFLLRDLLRRCREEWEIEYIESDVSAYSPRMQRTLLGLGFIPAGYIPAMVFHRVERLDGIKMVRLEVPCDFPDIQLHDQVKPIAEIVMHQCLSQHLVPRIVAKMEHQPLCNELDEEQRQRIAALGELKNYSAGETLFRPGDKNQNLQLILQGKIEILFEDKRVGIVTEGECLGEMRLLQTEPHTTTARALGEVEAYVLPASKLLETIRTRPDIGQQIYRNLARGLGEKLRRVNREK